MLILSNHPVMDSAVERKDGKNYKTQSSDGIKTIMVNVV